MHGFYKTKGSSVIQEKDIWTLLDSIKKGTFPDSPWTLLLARYDCHRNGPPLETPCPCVWRRPVGGAQSHTEVREYHWDWRDCKAERNIRLALQHRELTEIARG